MKYFVVLSRYAGVASVVYLRKCDDYGCYDPTTQDLMKMCFSFGGKYARYWDRREAEKFIKAVATNIAEKRFTNGRMKEFG